MTVRRERSHAVIPTSVGTRGVMHAISSTIELGSNSQFSGVPTHPVELSNFLKERQLSALSVFSVGGMEGRISLALEVALRDERHVFLRG